MCKLSSHRPSRLRCRSCLHTLQHSIQQHLRGQHSLWGPPFSGVSVPTILVCMQATAHQGSYSSIPQLQYNCVPKFAKSLVGTNATANCPAPQDFANGSALMAYNSTTFYDDLTYAAAWMYKASGGQQCCSTLVLGVQPAGCMQSAAVHCCSHCSAIAGLACCTDSSMHWQAARAA